MSEFSSEELAVCIKVLEALNENPSSFSVLAEDLRRKLEINAGKLSRPTRDQKKKRNKEAKKVKKSGNCLQRKTNSFRHRVFSQARRRVCIYKPHRKLIGINKEFLEEELFSPRNCYICKAEFKESSFFL
jgi:hypothetical protein